MTSRIRVINEGGEVACEHRDLSVCPECWASTPGLLSVYEREYNWSNGAGWTQAEIAEIVAGRMENVSLSPGTVVSEVSEVVR